MQTVLHHLAGENKRQTDKNILTAINNCLRLLKPDGQLLIIESTVRRYFEIIEIILYPIMQLFFKAVHFDRVYQYSAKSLLRLLTNAGIQVAEHNMVALDKYIWIMRRKVRTCLTPCQATYMRITKAKDEILDI